MFSGDFSNHFPYCFRFSGGINFTYILLPAFLFFFCFFYYFACFCSFCLYSKQFLMIGSFLNFFFKAAFLCWVAFFAFCIKPRFIFLLGMEFLGIHSSAIIIRVFVNFSTVWIFSFMSSIEQS